MKLLKWMLLKCKFYFRKIKGVGTSVVVHVWYVQIANTISECAGY